MRKPEAMRAITKAYSKLYYMDDAQSLAREGLTLSDYRTAVDVMQELRTPGSTADTFILSVAEFFKRCGYTVTAGAVSYKISC